MGTPISRLRLGFAGTPAFAAGFLRALIERHQVQVAYCRAPRPTGRGRKLALGPVEEIARSSGIDVRTPRTLRGEANTLAEYRLDLLIVVAYGLILPRSILDAPRHGCINVHASLLPRWRGAAPVERAMMAGDRATGISIMQMDDGLDTGPVLHQEQCVVRSDDTGDSLRARLATIGCTALLQSLENFGSVAPMVQPLEGVTYAEKLRPLESQIDWTGSAVDIALKVRALNSRQPAFCYVKGERVRLLFGEAMDTPTQVPPGTITAIDKKGLTVACGSGSVRVTLVALSRGKGTAMDIAALINGYPDLIRPGQVLDASS